MKAADDAVVFFTLFDCPIVAFEHHGRGNFAAAEKRDLAQF